MTMGKGVPKEMRVLMRMFQIPVTRVDLTPIMMGVMMMDMYGHDDD
jgi:hypothetical protein